MSTDITPTDDHGQLAIRDDQREFSARQVAALRQIGVGSASPADLAVFLHQCQRTGLDPFARQIYMIARSGKQTIQTGIDGYRLVARRATDRRAGATLGYADTEWCGPDGQWADVWLAATPPAAARVTVIRDGQRFPAIALLSEYDAGNSMWRSRPAGQLAKCAEALALRRAFPQDLSGLYTTEEMDQADRRERPSAAAMPPAPQHDDGVQVDRANLLDATAAATDIDQLRGIHGLAARLPDDERDEVRAATRARADDIRATATQPATDETDDTDDTEDDQ